MANGCVSIGPGYESDGDHGAVTHADACEHQSLTFAEAVTRPESDANKPTITCEQTVTDDQTRGQTIAGSSHAANHEDALVLAYFVSLGSYLPVSFS